jgi:hypothetical protein
MASSSRVRIRRKRDYGSGAMALTEYKVDRVRSRTASCIGLDRRICDDISEGSNNVATSLIFLDHHPHIRVSDAVRRRKVAEERTRDVQGVAYGDLMFWLCRGVRACTTLGFIRCGLREQFEAIMADMQGRRGAISAILASRPKSLPSTRTGRKKAGRALIQRGPSHAMPPPGTIMWTCG